MVQDPAKIMTKAVVAKKMAKNPHFPILDRIQINQQNYFDFLKYLVKPWVEKTFPETPMCFTEAHTLTQPKFLKSAQWVKFSEHSDKVFYSALWLL